MDEAALNDALADACPLSNSRRTAMAILAFPCIGCLRRASRKALTESADQAVRRRRQGFRYRGLGRSCHRIRSQLKSVDCLSQTAPIKAREAFWSGKAPIACLWAMASHVGFNLTALRVGRATFGNISTGIGRLSGMTHYCMFN